MDERREHWKENISKEAQARAAQRQALLVALEGVRSQIKCTGMNFKKYDELKAQQRRIVAELAVL